MKTLSSASHGMKMVGGALISVAILLHGRVGFAEGSQTDPQVLARNLLDHAASESSAEARPSWSDVHLDSQQQAQCLILGAACEIPRRNRASVVFTDVSTAPDVRQHDGDIDAADLARQMILGERA